MEYIWHEELEGIANPGRREIGRIFWKRCLSTAGTFQASEFSCTSRDNFWCLTWFRSLSHFHFFPSLFSSSLPFSLVISQFLNDFHFLLWKLKVVLHRLRRKNSQWMAPSILSTLIIVWLLYIITWMIQNCFLYEKRIEKKK